MRIGILEITHGFIHILHGLSHLFFVAKYVEKYIWKLHDKLAK